MIYLIKMVLSYVKRPEEIVVHIQEKIKLCLKNRIELVKTLSHFSLDNIFHEKLVTEEFTLISISGTLILH